MTFPHKHRLWIFFLLIATLTNRPNILQSKRTWGKSCIPSSRQPRTFSNALIFNSELVRVNLISNVSVLQMCVFSASASSDAARTENLRVRCTARTACECQISCWGHRRIAMGYEKTKIGKSEGCEIKPILKLEAEKPVSQNFRSVGC